MRQCTAEEFLKDVANHQMTIPLSDGVYRHVRFRSTVRGWNQWFDLVTWPGCLTISGDMGTWTFSRLPDMFEFFRDSQLRINEGYWAEKLQGGNCTGRSSGAMQFDAELFRERLFGQIKDFDLTAKQRGFVGRELKELLDSTDENEHYMYRAVYDFDCEVPGYGRFRFDGAELPNGRTYTYRFVWCLYAIVWGIQQFDNGMTVATQETGESVGSLSDQEGNKQ